MIGLRHFVDGEFDYPERMDQEFLLFLDEVRHDVGLAFYLTSDGRDHETNELVGGSEYSLHLFGGEGGASAVDFVTGSSRARNSQTFYADLWLIVDAVTRVASTVSRKVQLELVKGPDDWHIHLGLYRAGWSGPSKIVLSTT